MRRADTVTLGPKIHVPSWGFASDRSTEFKDVATALARLSQTPRHSSQLRSPFEADSVFSQLYSGGVKMYWCDTNLDHGGLPVDLKNKDKKEKMVRS